MKKKCILSKATLWFLCLFISMATLTAQVDTPTDGPEGPSLNQIPPGTAIIDNQRADDLNDGSPSDPQLLPGCEDVVHAYVFVTKLVKNLDGEGGGYAFPMNATPIFLKYQFPGNPDTGENIGIIEVPASTFEFKGMIDPESELRIFESHLQIHVDFSYVCQEANGNIAAFLYEIEIVSDLSGTPYPFHLNNHPDGLFSCHVFCDECPDSNTSSYCLDTDYLIPWIGPYTIDCTNCTDAVDVPNNFTVNDENNNASSGKNDNLIETGVAGSLQVSPNPARLETEIRFYSEYSGAMELLIFDASGRSVFNQSENAAAGYNEINISVDSWEKGIYYGILKSEHNTQSFKFLVL